MVPVQYCTSAVTANRRYLRTRTQRRATWSTAPGLRALFDGLPYSLSAVVSAVTAIRQYLSTAFARSAYYQVIGQFQSTEYLLNNSAYNLWEYFYSLTPEGSTLLVPSDLAWAQPEVQLVLRMRNGMVPDDGTIEAWNVNHALFHCLGGFKSDAEWGVSWEPLHRRDPGLQGSTMFSTVCCSALFVCHQAALRLTYCLRGFKSDVEWGVSWDLYVDNARATG